jgi:two-component system cell cycle sensor histidine kinase/response regulator CckA
MVYVSQTLSPRRICGPCCLIVHTHARFQVVFSEFENGRMKKPPKHAGKPTLAQTEDLLQLQATALEVAVNPIVITRRDGTIIWVNRAFEQLSGYMKDEAIGQSANLLRSGQHPASFYKSMWEAILSGKRWQGELVNRRKDGSLYQEEMTITPVKEKTQDISHFIAIKLDISERKRAEERICRLAQVVENSAEMIAIGDSSGRISFANQALLRATGYDENELIGEFFGTTLLSPNNPPNLDQEIRLRTITDGGWRGECLRGCKNGTEFPMLLSTGQIKNSQGLVIGTFGISHDITERLHLEEQLRVSQKMEAVGRLAGGVAHDFNNILGVILGYTDLLLEGFSPEDSRCHQAQQIKKAAVRATSLTRQLLAFSRKQVFQPRVLDLNALVADFNKMVGRLVGEDIELVNILQPDLGHIKADPGQIEQVIMNLVVNSRDAMPTGGKLIIETANAELDEAYCRSHPSVQPGSYIMIAVRDTGLGMDAKTQARIFEPFFTTKELGRGTGLGLATVYGIVKQSQGNIWVYSEIGKGTTFKIYFPRVDEPIQTMEIDRGKAESSRGSETILLAEDAEALRELTCALMETYGYKVLVAENSKEAIAVAEQPGLRIDLLLTDVVMPGMSGRELADHLKAKHPAMKVLYMSGYTNDAIVQHGVLEPGIFFIEKPFSQAALMLKLREVLDHR